jgi:hypothetical protein
MKSTLSIDTDSAETEMIRINNDIRLLIKATTKEVAIAI